VLIPNDETAATKFVAFPSQPSPASPNFHTSVDGASWTARNISADGAGGYYDDDGYITGGSYSNGHYAIARSRGNSLTMRIAYSTDGDYWTIRSVTKGDLNEDPISRPLHYFNGYWYLVTDSAIYRSTSLGGAFTAYVPGWPTTAMRDAYVWQARNLLVICQSDNIRYTTDAIAWYTLNAPGAGIGLRRFVGDPTGVAWVCGRPSVFPYSASSSVIFGT